MVKELKRINIQTLNVILYVNNNALQYFIETLLKARFKVDGDYVLYANTAKSLREAYSETVVIPDSGERWLVNIDADSISKSDLIKSLNMVRPDSLNIYWVSKYKVYKDLINSDIVKKQGVYCYTNYISRLSERDIYDIFNDSFANRKKKVLDDKLLDFVAESYQWDIQAIFDLIAYLKSGNDFESKKDIVEVVGVGGNTVDKFTLNLLLCNVQSLAGKKKVISKYLKLLSDLSYSYKFSTIRNYMLSTINGFIDMKQLQIMGLYRRGKAKIPEVYDEKRLARLRRYEWAVLEKITLPRLLLLRQCLKVNNNFNTEVELVKSIIMYIDNLQDTSLEPLKKERVTKSKTVKSVDKNKSDTSVEKSDSLSDNYDKNIKALKSLLLGNK